MRAIAAACSAVGSGARSRASAAGASGRASQPHLSVLRHAPQERPRGAGLALQLGEPARTVRERGEHGTTGGVQPAIVWTAARPRSRSPARRAAAGRARARERASSRSTPRSRARARRDRAGRPGRSVGSTARRPSLSASPVADHDPVDDAGAERRAHDRPDRERRVALGPEVVERSRQRARRDERYDVQRRDRRHRLEDRIAARARSRCLRARLQRDRLRRRAAAGGDLRRALRRDRPRTSPARATRRSSPASPIPRSSPRGIALAGRAHEAGLAERLVAGYTTRYLERVRAQSPITRGCRSVRARRCRARSDRDRVGRATRDGRGRARRSRARARCFTAIVTSEDVVRGKPDPEPLPPRPRAPRRGHLRRTRSGSSRMRPSASSRRVRRACTWWRFAPPPTTPTWRQPTSSSTGSTRGSSTGSSRRMRERGARSTTSSTSFPRSRGGERTVAELPGGLTNTNYKVDVGGRSYVVRVSGKDTSLLAIDREHEHHNSVAAAEVGVGAAVVDYLPERSILVLEFIVGRTQSAEDLRRGDRLDWRRRGVPAPARRSPLPRRLRHVRDPGALPPARRRARVPPAASATTSSRRRSRRCARPSPSATRAPSRATTTCSRRTSSTSATASG